MASTFTTNFGFEAVATSLCIWISSNAACKSAI